MNTKEQYENLAKLLWMCTWTMMFGFSIFTILHSNLAFFFKTFNVTINLYLFFKMLNSTYK